MFSSRRLSLIDKNQRGGLVSNLDRLEKVGVVLPPPTPNLHPLHLATLQKD